MDSDMENSICNNYEKMHYFKYRKYQNLWTNNKGRGEGD